MSSKKPDFVFRKFAAKLADAVLVAINSGIKVSARDGSCHCPLGCLVGTSSRPIFIPWHVRNQCGIGDVKQPVLMLFIEGFDSGRGVGQYAALGRAYRARFP